MSDAGFSFSTMATLATSGFKLGVAFASAVSASSLLFERASYYILESGISLITDGLVSAYLDYVLKRGLMSYIWFVSLVAETSSSTLF